MKASAKEYQRLLFTLDAFTDLSQQAVETRELATASRSILYLLLGSVGVPRGALWRCDAVGRLHPMAIKGGPTGARRGAEFDRTLPMFKRNEAAEFLETPELLAANDKRLPTALRTYLSRTGLTQVLPLVMRGRLSGLLGLGSRLNAAPLTVHERGALETLGRYAAVLLFQHDLMQTLRAAVEENVRLCDTLASTYFDTVQAFSTAIDAKDVYTRGHSVRVARYSSALAGRLQLSRKAAAGIRIGAYLHDIGKIVLDRALLNKPGSLSNDERSEVAYHPLVGDEVLSAVSFPWPEVRSVVRSHHERVDGNGYPDGLQGNQIPLPARVLALADAFDAMTSNRPYRNRMPLDLALSELVRCSGDQFEPAVVRGFLKQCRSEVESREKNGKAHKNGDPDKQQPLRVFGPLLDRSGGRVTTSAIDSLLKKLGPVAALQPA